MDMDPFVSEGSPVTDYHHYYGETTTHALGFGGSFVDQPAWLYSDVLMVDKGSYDDGSAN